MKSKDYARVLDALISKESDKVRVQKKTRGFMAYVSLRGDGHLLRSIIRDLEFRWRNEALRVDIETAENNETKSAERGEKMREEMRKRGTCPDIRIRKNPRLISGVRVTLGESVRVNSSWKGMVENLFPRTS